MYDSAKKRISVVVHGRVQGVGFRYFVLNKANSIGIKGWVKNLPDGTVATVAEGDEIELNKFLDILRKGPSFSQVSKVDVVWGEYQENFRSFDVTF